MASALLAEKPTQTQTNDSKTALLNKAESKMNLFKNLGWKHTKKTPLACITYALTDKNHVGLIQSIMPGLLEQDIVLVLMGIGTEKYQSYFTQLTKDHPDQVAILEESEANREDLYAAADILICPSDSQEAQAAIQQALANMLVPVALSQGNLIDYDPVQEKGNAFTFQRLTPWSLFTSLVRALENFKFPYDWKNIQKGEF